MHRFSFTNITAFALAILAVGFLFAVKTNAIDINVKDIDTTIENNIHTNANTGGNTSSGGSITTGDANAGSVVTNLVNTNVIQNCCTTPTPTQPADPTATPVPPATPTPTPPASNNGGGGGGGGNASSQGDGSGGGSSSPAPQGQVLGLSSTAGNGAEAALLYIIGSLCLSAGTKLLDIKRFLA